MLRLPRPAVPLGRRLVGHAQRITTIGFSPDGSSLATSSADGTVLLWDVEIQEPVGSPLAVVPDMFVSAVLSRLAENRKGRAFAALRHRGVRRLGKA